MFCTVSVDYQGDVATSETLKVGERQRCHDLVFRLSEASIPPVPTASTPPPADVQVPPPVPQVPNPIGAWVVNPANRHAYKRIRCRNWADARAMAISEGAHLVSINNEAEQKWLVEVFGLRRFLIGLTHKENQTEWQWTSGEPLEFTNWAAQGMATARNAFVFVGIDGKWRIETPESLQRIGIALLEKEVDRLDAK